MSRVLLTGAAGFIGSAVAAELIRQGHRVLGVDNLNDAYDVRLKEWRLAQLAALPDFEFRRAELTQRDVVRALWDGEPEPFAAVINLAARAGVRASIACPDLFYDTNLGATLHLLDLCKERGTAKFVLSSTSSAYGNSDQRPYREDSNASRPLSPYAASKLAAESLAFSYHHLYRIDTTVLRYFTVYGPAGRPDMAPFRFVKWISEGTPVTIFGDGSQQRDFTFVTDIAAGTVAALRPVGYEIVNLGCDRPVALLDMLRLVEQEVGKKAELVFKPRSEADAIGTWADITKAEMLLHWSPQVPLASGVARMASWYADNRDWARSIVTGS